MSCRILTLSALVLGLAFSSPAAAQRLDEASTEALVATMRTLQDPVLRAAAIAGNPIAGAADQQLRSLAPSEALRQELYEFAAEACDELVRGAGGDAQQAAQALTRGQADPASFAAMLSPRLQTRLRELAVKITDQRR